ncbi:MAG: MmgE/PrpD family protein [Phycisphaeraceae bacterium]|nr:MmgE/PrpD family protein [Phycisphaeraceae bacterium]
MASGHTESKRYLSMDLAEWASGLRYEHLSPAAIRAAKLFLYDSFGCALGGSQQEDAHILLAHHKEMAAAGRGRCTAFVSGFKTNPVDAAFLNGHMIRAMDYNDIYWKADPCHPSDIISGPLALCEYKGLGGKDLIVATVIAYEVEMRLCEAGVPGVREYGWHHATLTAFAAPLAAGRVLGLTPAQHVAAMGISAARTFSPGAVTAGKLTNMKNTVDPWATRMGVESAMLAARGYSGPEHIIDGKEGLYAVFGHVQYKGQAARFDSDKLVGGLPRTRGDHYKIIDCGMKSYPIEALSHAPLTAMMKCVKENGVRAEQVAEIRVEVIARAADILGDPHKYRPDSKETADHSLPYCMAVGLVDGMVTPLQFKEERVMDRGLIPVMDKVKVVANDEFEALFPKFQPSRVTITTTDGRSFSKRVDVPKGDPRDPMTEEEIGVKFTALGQDVVGRQRCAELGRVIMSIENEKTLGRFMRLMTKGGGGGAAKKASRNGRVGSGKRTSSAGRTRPAARVSKTTAAKKKAARR